MRLGEFDPPQMNPYNKISVDVVQSQAHRDLALRIAKMTFVLLKNTKNVLPVKKTVSKVAVSLRLVALARRTLLHATLRIFSKSHWRGIDLIRCCFCTGVNGGAPPCVVRRTVQRGVQSENVVVPRAERDPPQSSRVNQGRTVNEGTRPDRNVVVQVTVVPFLCCTDRGSVGEQHRSSIWEILF